MENKKTILVFCAGEQKETQHTLDIDQAGEIVLTCVNDPRTPEEIAAATSQEPVTCGRFIKYPKGTSASDLKSHLVAHKDANVGQVSAEEQEAQKNAIIDELMAPDKE